MTTENNSLNVNPDIERGDHHHNIHSTLTRLLDKFPNELLLPLSPSLVFILFFTIYTDNLSSGYNQVMGPIIQEIIDELAPAQANVVNAGALGIFNQFSIVARNEAIGLIGAVIIIHIFLFKQLNKLQSRLTARIDAETSLTKKTIKKLSAIIPGMLISILANYCFMSFLFQNIGRHTATSFIDEHTNNSTQELPSLIHFKPTISNEPAILSLVQALISCLAFPILDKVINRFFIDFHLRQPNWYARRMLLVKQKRTQCKNRISNVIKGFLSVIFFYGIYAKAFNDEYLKKTGAYYLLNADYLSQRLFTPLFYSMSELSICYLAMLLISKYSSSLAHFCLGLENPNTLQKGLDALLPSIIFTILLYIISFGIKAIAMDDADILAETTEEVLIFNIQDYLPIPIIALAAFLSVTFDFGYFAVSFVNEYCSARQNDETRPLLLYQDSSSTSTSIVAAG